MVGGSFTLAPVSDFGSKASKNQFESKSFGPRNPEKAIVLFLLVGAMPPHAGTDSVPPPPVGATRPQAGGEAAALRLRVRFLFGPRLSFLLLPRRQESADKMSMSCCLGRDLM